MENVANGGTFARNLAERGGDFVTKSEVQRQARRYSPAVLYIKAEGVPHARTVGDGTDRIDLKLLRNILKEILNPAERPRPVDIRSGLYPAAITVYQCSEFQGVLALNPGH